MKEEISINNILDIIKWKMKDTGITITGYMEIRKVSEKVFYKTFINPKIASTFLEEIISFSIPALFLLSRWIEQNPCDKVVIEDCNLKSEVPIDDIQYPHYTELNGRMPNKFYFYHINIDRVLYIYILKESNKNQN